MSDIGHNSGDERQHGMGGGAVAADELRLLIERVERLTEERQGIMDDIKDVFAESKGRGYDPKAMRKILSIRKKKKEEYQEEEAILEVYLQALGMILAMDMLHALAVGNVLGDSIAFSDLTVRAIWRWWNN